MGQLEKYGLYVLCLVIFLILGVAIWGEPLVPNGESAARSPAPATGKAPAKAGAPVFDLNALMSPAGKPVDAGHEPSAGKPAAEPVGKKEKTDPPAKAPAAEPPARPEARPSYTIRSGDTFERIAKDKLGDVRFVALLRDLNPKAQPERLQPGKELMLPTAAELASKRKPVAAETKPGGSAAVAMDAVKSKGKDHVEPQPAAAARTHTIEHGDTLEGLAKRYFGDSRRLEDIKSLNPTIDPTRLRIGQLIRLPAK